MKVELLQDLQYTGDAALIGSFNVPMKFQDCLIIPVEYFLMVCVQLFWGSGSGMSFANCFLVTSTLDHFVLQMFFLPKIQ